MEKVTDELLSGISDELTNEIELFLINNISDKDDQLKIVQLINQAYTEGSVSALDFISQAKENFKEEASEFQKEFQKKLLDGQDKPVSE